MSTSLLSEGAIKFFSSVRWGGCFWILTIIGGLFLNFAHHRGLFLNFNHHRGGGLFLIFRNFSLKNQLLIKEKQFLRKKIKKKSNFFHHRGGAVFEFWPS